MDNNAVSAAPIKQKSSFTGQIGFVLAAAGSAVGLGNIWRFPYLAAKHGGGLFILVYIILAATFGFALLATDIAIGRKTGKNALQAYGSLSKKWGFLGGISFIIPAIILAYYSVIGGWIIRYIFDFVDNDTFVMANPDYFSGFITDIKAPIVYMLLFLALTAIVVYFGVEKGIEKFSKFIMPALLVLIVAIAAFALTRTHDGKNGLDGLGRYFIPDFNNVTPESFFQLLLDAVGQLFYSLSVAMGIMITYGSYVKKDVNLTKSVIQIQVFDTVVAVLAGIMVVPTVFIFQGEKGLTESGPGLMFQSLPTVFNEMGAIGSIVGIAFFIMVLFAALTSSVSIMETIVASCMGFFKTTRKKASLIIAAIFIGLATVVCLGYNVFYFNITLPNGSAAQLLDILDYASNSILMPLLALLTCILIGWVLKPKTIIEEMQYGGAKFGLKYLYIAIIKFVAPLLLILILAQALGLTQLIF